VLLLIRRSILSACSFDWWLMADADLNRGKSTAIKLVVVAGLS
jgi:hypothetical protein